MIGQINSASFALYGAAIDKVPQKTAGQSEPPAGLDGLQICWRGEPSQIINDIAVVDPSGSVPPNLAKDTSTYLLGLAYVMVKREIMYFRSIQLKYNFNEYGGNKFPDKDVNEYGMEWPVKMSGTKKVPMTVLDMIEGVKPAGAPENLSAPEIPPKLK